MQNDRELDSGNPMANLIPHFPSQGCMPEALPAKPTPNLLESLNQMGTVMDASFI